MGYQTASAKPNAVILSYPVITSGDCAHRGSFTALLGADASEEELEYMSLDYRRKRFRMRSMYFQKENTDCHLLMKHGQMKK